MVDSLAVSSHNGIRLFARQHEYDAFDYTAPQANADWRDHD